MENSPNPVRPAKEGPTRTGRMPQAEAKPSVEPTGGVGAVRSDARPQGSGPVVPGTDRSAGTPTSTAQPTGRHALASGKGKDAHADVARPKGQPQDAATRPAQDDAASCGSDSGSWQVLQDAARRGHGRPGAKDTLTDHEQAALLNVADQGVSDGGLDALLDFLYVEMVQHPGDPTAAHQARASVGDLIARLGPGARAWYARHLDPQRVAEVAIDPVARTWRRLAAMRMLEMGVEPQGSRVRCSAGDLGLPTVTWAMVCEIAGRHGLAAASEALSLFTGIAPDRADTVVREAA